MYCTAYIGHLQHAISDSILGIHHLPSPFLIGISHVPILLWFGMYLMPICTYCVWHAMCASLCIVGTPHVSSFSCIFWHTSYAISLFSHVKYDIVPFRFLPSLPRRFLRLLPLPPFPLPPSASWGLVPCPYPYPTTKHIVRVWACPCTRCSTHAALCSHR